MFPHDILWAQSPVWCDSERPVVLAVVIMHVHCLVIFIGRLVQYSEPKLWCSSNEKHYTLSLVCGQMKSSYILVLIAQTLFVALYTKRIGETEMMQPYLQYIPRN